VSETDPRDTIRHFLDAGWRVLLLSGDGDGLDMKEATLGPRGSIVQASPGLWARFADRKLAD
jgi:hypothetical protein